MAKPYDANPKDLAEIFPRDWATFFGVDSQAPVTAGPRRMFARQFRRSLNRPSLKALPRADLMWRVGLTYWRRCNPLAVDPVKADALLPHEQQCTFGIVVRLLRGGKEKTGLAAYSPVR
ncbi:MAG: hypothetical protein ACKV0T_29705 [Planctomycetales bacterium]